MKPCDGKLDLFGRRVMVATKNDPEPTGVTVDMIVTVNGMGSWWGIDRPLIAVLWREQAT